MSNDYKVGRGKPPKSGQFQKGRSGNPNGRPRKAHGKQGAHLDTALSAPRFNHAMLAEAERQIQVNGEPRTTREAIMQALAVAAMRGGILAMRTWLDMSEREEARLREVRLPVYTSWEAFKIEGQMALKQAADDGVPEPLILPHPDDIILDSDNLLVKLVGPTTEEHLRVYERVRDTRDLFFELMMFTDTPLINYGDPATHCIGILGAEWIWYHGKLPKRLRGMELCLQRLETNMLRGRRYWEDDLRQRCEERSYDFKILGQSRFMRTWPMKDLGMKFEGGMPVPATPETKKELKRLIAAETG